MSENFNKNRIFKNTLLLYGRMLFTMWLNLYTTRLVLTNLGIEDMGVYGVVGSITSLFTVFVSGITNAVQRFITFELGKRNGNIKNVFCTSLNILFIAAIFLFIILEIGGIWVLNHKINIPIQSIEAAWWVFQLSIITCIVNLISIPYNALIIAHERMDAFAFISILQVILTCITAYSLSYFSHNRLLIYALLTASVSIVIRIIYQVYCHYKFSEARYYFIIDKKLLKEIGKYAGISTTSSALQLISNQGITFIINWTFGVTINAVYNIALQLKNSILSFSLNLLKAISPQITKTYASGEMETHKKLIYSGSKMEAFLIFFIMIPFLFHTEYIMELWLGNVPKYTVAFAQCIVFISLTYSVFEPIRAAVLATKKITKFMLIPDCFYLLVLPTSYFIGIFFRMPELMILCIILMEILTCILRIHLATKVTIISKKGCINKILLPCLKVAAISCCCCYILAYFIQETIIGLVFIIILNSIVLILSIYVAGLDQNEKIIVKNSLYKIRETTISVITSYKRR